MTDDERNAAMRFDKDVYEAALLLAKSTPIDLNAFHFEQLGIVSKRAEAAAREAQRQAQLAIVQANMATAPLVTKSAEPAAPAETVDEFLERRGIPAAVDTHGVVYDAKQFEEAHDRYFANATSLTLDDLKQFAVVDPRLATVARAKQLGHKTRYTDAERKFGREPVSHKIFARWVHRWMLPLLSTYRYKGDLAHSRIDALEQRVLELEAQQAAKSDVLT